MQIRFNFILGAQRKSEFISICAEGEGGSLELKLWDSINYVSCVV